MPGRKHPEPRNQGLRGRHILEAEVPAQCVAIKRTYFAGISQGLSFRGEAQQPGMPVFLLDDVAERLDAERIPRTKQLTVHGVPDGKREHAPQPVQDILAVPGVRLQEDLGIRVRPQVHTLPLELVTELDVVVDFTVEHHAVATVGRTHRLAAACGQVDDR